MRVEVAAQDVDDVLLAEDGAERLVLAAEAEAHETVPLDEVDGGRLPPRGDADYGGLHLGRRFEVVLADLDQMLHISEQGCVDRQAAVQFVACFCAKSEGKLTLIHENSRTKERAVH